VPCRAIPVRPDGGEGNAYSYPSRVFVPIHRHEAARGGWPGPARHLARAGQQASQQAGGRLLKNVRACVVRWLLVRDLVPTMKLSHPRRSASSGEVASMAARRPEVRSMSARIAANSRWAREFHRQEATAAARHGFYRRFEREVDPDGVLAPDERAKRVENAVSAYFTRMALRSAQTRRARHAGPQRRRPGPRRT
jgi:hypothetical protein